MLLTIIGWLLALGMVTTAFTAAADAAHEHQAKNKPRLLSALAAMFCATCLAVILLTLVGFISPVLGAIAATLPAIGAVITIGADKEAPAIATGYALRALWHAGDLRRVRNLSADDLGNVQVLDDHRPDSAEELAAAAPDALPPPGPVRPPKLRSVPPPEERTDPPVSTPPPASPPAPPTSGAGAAADVLSGVHVLCTHALSGGQQSLERTTLTLAEVAKGMGRALHTLGTRLSEPDQHYGPEVWEKFLAMAKHLQGAAMTGTEASSTLHMVGSTPLREFGASGVTAPHHDKVNQV